MEELSAETLERIAQAHAVTGDATDVSPNPIGTIRDLLIQQVDRFEVKPFLVFYGEGTPRREMTYREFFEDVGGTAQALFASGVRRGTRVAVLSINHSDLVVHDMAVWALGASVVPLNPAESDRFLGHVLTDSGAGVLLVRDLFFARACALAETVPGPLTIIQTGEKQSPSHLHLGTEVQRHPPSLGGLPAPRADDEALLAYTTGSAGAPRGVQLTHANLLAEAAAIAEWHQVSESETVMGVLPLHHVHGIVGSVLTPLVGGSTIVLNQKFHPDRFFERISAERVAVVSVVPTVLQFLLHAKPDMAAYKLASFRHVMCGGGPLTVELAGRFEHTFKIPIIHGYGLTETSSYTSFVPIDLDPATHRRWLSHFGFPSVGVALPHNVMAILDAEGHELDEGQRGEIVVRGPNVFQRYLRNPEANEETFRFGWCRTGDEGFFQYDDEGRQFFFITGRHKELIIRGGVNISPFEIDEVLMRIPGVQSAAAVGFENTWYGEEVGAVVVSKPDVALTDDQVLTACRRQLPFAKCPKVVVFARELPLDSTGRVQRTPCRELFVPWKGEQFADRSA